MSAFIHHELLLLLRTIAVGAVLLLCYDLLAAFRNVFAHSDKAVGTEDILYWLCCAFFVFSEIYRSNEGILRFFMVLGFLSGAYICNRVLGVQAAHSEIYQTSGCGNCTDRCGCSGYPQYFLSKKSLFTDYFISGSCTGGGCGRKYCKRNTDA